MTLKRLASLPGVPAILAAVSGVVFLFGSAQAPAEQMATPPYLSRFPNVNPQLTTQLPGDVDIAMKKSLESKKEFARVQRLFDLWSWQAFVTLNWPTDDHGQFAPKLGDTAFGPPNWTTWYESSSIYLPHGAAPSACAKSGAAMPLSLTRDTSQPVVHGLQPFQVPPTFDKRRVRLLGNISAVGERSPSTPAKEVKGTKLDEITQAFASPLIDQNGNFVFYEIVIDPNEVSYICQNKLYNVNGQVAFSKGGTVSADLPRGVDNKNASGAWETKFAWRILTARDDASRFLSAKAIVPPVNGVCPDGSKPATPQCDVAIGLVGMHIGHKSVSSPQWIWATFEQVDNLSVDNVVQPKLMPSFFDPNCPLCMPNQAPTQASDGTWATSPKTQVARAIPIPADKVALNNEASAALHAANSPLQYYQLIDTQWPTDPSAKPTPWNAGLPGAIENKPGGNPTPVYLTNVTMETYFQHGAQPACGQEEAPSNAQCPAGSWVSTGQPGTVAADQTTIFGSESCTGCHSSAGLHTSLDGKKSGQLTGDFSWLFSTKAGLDTSQGK